MPFRSLIPPGEPVSAAGALAGYDPRAAAPAGRPRLALNMVASVDGHVTRAGRSGGLSNAGDRELFHWLRTIPDAVMVGAGTARIERYGPLVRDPEMRAVREANGLDPQPLAVIVSHRLLLDPELPLLADPASRVVVLTDSDGELRSCAARIDYLRAQRLRDQLIELRARFGVSALLCEGGPMLNSGLLSEGLVDDLFISIAPLILGGAEPLTMVSGRTGQTDLELEQVLESDGQLFARYSVRH